MKGKERKKITENSKRNDLRDGRNKVAGYYDMNDKNIPLHGCDRKKYNKENHYKKVHNLSWLSNLSKIPFHVNLGDGYLSKWSQPCTIKKKIYIDFFQSK